MKEAFAQRKLAWPTLTAQELTDMLVYLQNLPETRNLAAQLLVSAVRLRRRSSSNRRAAPDATPASSRSNRACATRPSPGSRRPCGTTSPA